MRSRHDISLGYKVATHKTNVFPPVQSGQGWKIMQCNIGRIQQQITYTHAKNSGWLKYFLFFCRVRQSTDREQLQPITCAHIGKELHISQNHPSAQRTPPKQQESLLPTSCEQMQTEFSDHEASRVKGGRPRSARVVWAIADQNSTNKQLIIDRWALWFPSKVLSGDLAAGILPQ